MDNSAEAPKDLIRVQRESMPPPPSSSKSHVAIFLSRRGIHLRGEET